MQLGFCHVLYNLSAEMVETGTGGSLKFPGQPALALGGIQANESCIQKLGRQYLRKKHPRWSPGFHWYIHTCALMCTCTHIPQRKATVSFTCAISEEKEAHLTECKKVVTDGENREMLVKGFNI